MTDDRSCQNKCKQMVCRVQYPQGKMYGKESLRKFQAEDQDPCPHTGVAESVECAGITVIAHLADINAVQILRDQSGEKYAARQISQKDKEIILLHDTPSF